ncbi:MAG TPA: DNA polymerase III subunit beta [Ruminococcaceae bacterium]|nr:DNA polymerase III subunit beta [Oscillospiraceae bacterium]
MTCEKQILSEAVSNVSRAVSTKSTLSALEGILLKASGGSLTLTGYDLDMGISTSIEAYVKEEGEIVLSARLFFDMIKKMPSDKITITTSEKYLTTIKGDVTEYSILGIPANEFPELPVLNDTNTVAINQDILKSMIGQTLFAIATTDSKPVHTGSLFDIENNQITVVSVDGYRLAMRKEAAQTSQNLSFIVPGKTLAEVSKLLEEKDTPVEIKVSRKHIIFNIDGYMVVSRLLEGEFLDYKTAIPQNSTTTVNVTTRECIDCIERASLIISDRLKSPLKVSFENNAIKFSCTTAIGKAYDEIDCKVSGNPVEMGFNHKYLSDALRASECDEVRMEINGPLSPVKILPPSGDSFLFLVLPVRLKAE